MSAQAGVFHTDGRPVERSLVERLGDSMSLYGPDGGGAVVSGPTGLAYRAFHVTPESCFDTQPTLSRYGTVMTWDGRLDNREDLLTQLRRELEGTTHTDSAIALAAFDRWGSSCFGRLIGDWALAIWQPNIKTLFLARDFAGSCPLYYSQLVPRTFLWSSELELLAETVMSAQGTKTRLNEKWIAGYLALHPPNDSTPFLNILPVIPGTYLQVTPEGVSAHKHWAPDPAMAIRYRSDAEYEERFRHLFRQSVRRRLRAKGSVWAQLSGGLDSSAIVCMVDDIFTRGGVVAEGLETMTAIYLKSPESDEREFATSVEAQCGRPAHHYDELRYPPLHDFRHLRKVAMPECYDCFAIIERAVRQDMAASGARLMLSGLGGDEMLGNIGNGSASIRDHIWEGNIGTCWKTLSKWAVVAKSSRVAFALDIAVSSLPRKILSRVGRSESSQMRLAIVQDSFCKRMKLNEKVVPALNDQFKLRRPSEQARSTALGSVIDLVARGVTRRVGLAQMAYPYLDRDLVSFLLSVPADQLERPGERRSLMRRALRGLLPEKVLRRRTKVSPDSALYRAFARNWSPLSALMSNPLVCQLGFVDPVRLPGLMQRVLHGTFPVTIVCNALSLEAWLKSHACIVDVGCAVARPDNTSCEQVATLCP